MPFDMDEFGGTSEEAALANPPEPIDPRLAAVQALRPPAPPAPPIVVPPNADAIVASMLGKQPPPAPQQPQTVQEAMEVAEDEYMSEVEERLEVAAHYRLLLQDTFFQTNSRAAYRVTSELRAWVRERLAELVGMNSAPKVKLTDEQIQVLSELTPAQVLALKSVADKLIAGGFTAPPSAAGAQVPAPKKPQTPAAPALVKRAAPAPNAQVSAQPPPDPTDPEQPPRRGPGRPPGAKNKHKQVNNPNKIKFPASNAEMSAATYAVSAQQEARTANRADVALAMSLPAKS